MPHLLLLAILLAQAPAGDAPELQGSARSDQYDFEIGMPKGWEAVRQPAHAFFRIQAPAGTIADGSVWLMHQESQQPVTLSFIVESFKKKAETEYAGFKAVSDRELTVGGFPAIQLVFTATPRDDKPILFVHTIIQRQLQEYFIFDAVAAPAEKDRIVAVANTMLGSFRSGIVAQPERDQKIAKTAGVLKSAAARTSLAGTQWHLLLVAEKRLGWQRTVVRDVKIDGAPGWEFEVELFQEDLEGGRRTDVAKGSISGDWATQKVDFHRMVRTPKDPPVDVSETAVLAKGEMTVVREYLGMKVEKKLKPPEGTILGDGAEIARRIIALSPGGNYSLRVLEPFRDIPFGEDWVHAGKAKHRMDGEELELIQALVSFTRHAALEYHFDVDGSMRRRKSSMMELKRCTEEEARKR